LPNIYVKFLSIELNFQIIASPILVE